MDVHPTKNVSIGIDPYTYVTISVFICEPKEGNRKPLEPSVLGTKSEQN